MLVYFSQYETITRQFAYNTVRNDQLKNVRSLPSETSSLVYIRKPSAQRVLAVSCLDAEHVGTQHMLVVRLISTVHVIRRTIPHQPNYERKDKHGDGFR